jgi:hypothetical protein
VNGDFGPDWDQEEVEVTETDDDASFPSFTDDEIAEMERIEERWQQDWAERTGHRPDGETGGTSQRSADG